MFIVGLLAVFTLIRAFAGNDYEAAQVTPVELIEQG